LPIVPLFAITLFNYTFHSILVNGKYKYLYNSSLDIRYPIISTQWLRVNDYDHRFHL